jgi:hypothetical protein
MRPITARVTTANPLAYVRLDEFHGAAVAVAAAIEAGTVTGAAYQIDYTFQDPNDLISPVALASINWDASLIPAAAKTATTNTTFGIATAPIWARVQLLGGGATSVRVVFTQYDPYYVGAAAGGAAAPVVWTPATPVAPYTGSFVSSVTFNNVPTGVGLVLIGVTTSAFNAPPSGITVNGVSATPVMTIASTGAGGALFQYNNPSGTTATMVVAVGGANVTCITTGLLTGLQSTTATATSASQSNGGVTSPFALGSTITPNAGGIVIALAVGNSVSSPLPIVWGAASGATPVPDHGTEIWNVTGNAPFIGFAHISGASNPQFSGTISIDYNAWNLYAAAYR